MIDDADRVLLQRALELAERGARTAAPNPRVGCVIARNGTVVAEGWHIAPGLAHAEAMALDVAQEGARDATVYVTLEPCAHHGRTPPCSDALIAAGVERVVVLSNDPAPHASGKGLLQLVDAGIPVDIVDDDDPLAIAARRQNAGFRSAMTLGRPHLTYKAAQTLDGRTATRTGDSRWISGPEARARVHELRAQAGAVLVGSGTALTDDPELTARDCDPPAETQPLRIVWDRSARLGAASRLAQTVAQGPVLLLCAPGADAGRRAAVAETGIEVVEVDDLHAGLAVLHARGIQSILCEGGAGLAGALLRAELLDRMIVVTAPKLLGDPIAPGIIGETGTPSDQMSDALGLAAWSCERIGDDLWIDAWLREPR
ncbi:MAG: bifunctional diaminohydroxyphosphoribosylaminopyrimidine deaminase/5-amino-6-(5-phosphoribosylamino)uracil reductase RibD [Actinobacteria bacterium]|nr:bifunctional diaminohydroxyphosphoribosylaminopyrimidine deaminase/5-amino-6-(5-phosphoribosylamino)uracil reductase RibD [Actinomycetota bacterium]